MTNPRVRGPRRRYTTLEQSIEGDGGDVNIELGQGKDGQARGAITFGPDQQTAIKLLARADLSTFLHESGHFFVEVMADLASQPGASAQIQTDMQTLLAAAGHEGDLASWRAMDADGRRDVHETLARSFEAYVMEGKAPSAALRPVFARFRAWLLSVYTSLRSLNVTLTPEVRAVFNRMLASDAAIAEAQQQGHQRPLWLTPELAGMTPEQFEKVPRSDRRRLTARARAARPGAARRSAPRADRAVEGAEGVHRRDGHQRGACASRCIRRSPRCRRARSPTARRSSRAASRRRSSLIGRRSSTSSARTG